MSATETGIEWTDATWNPIRGCSRVSEGCRNCYAERVAARFSGPGMPYEGLARDGRWTGKVRLIEELMEAPRRWKRPRRVFVNSMSDLFHEDLDAATIGRIFNVMALAPQHTFQVLTKRPERMRQVVGEYVETFLHGTPLQNVWLGVSVEDQKTADERIPLLLQTPSAVRFVSAEPLLGPVDVKRFMDGSFTHTDDDDCATVRTKLPPVTWRPLYGIDWVIVGGESGPEARPMHPAWALSLRDQCQAAGVSFFFKQWGEWADCPRGGLSARIKIVQDPATGAVARMARVGKRATGRLLAGREWNEFPKETT